MSPSSRPRLAIFAAPLEIRPLNVMADSVSPTSRASRSSQFIPSNHSVLIRGWNHVFGTRPQPTFGRFCTNVLGCIFRISRRSTCRASNSATLPATQPLLNMILGIVLDRRFRGLSPAAIGSAVVLLAPRERPLLPSWSRTSKRFRDLSMKLSVKANCSQRGPCGFFGFLKSRLPNIDFGTRMTNQNSELPPRTCPLLGPWLWTPQKSGPIRTECRPGTILNEPANSPVSYERCPDDKIYTSGDKTCLGILSQVAHDTTVRLTDCAFMPFSKKKGEKENASNYGWRRFPHLRR